MNNIEKLFTGIGGTFLSSAQEIGVKLKDVRAFVFDWDGVFNDGEKKESGSSLFNEADSMGLNLIRFSYWLQHHKLPATAIISGEKNEVAFWFSRREHLHSSYYKVSHKIEGLDHFCKEHALSHEQVAYVFDDVADLSIAHVCGIRIMVRRKASPLFSEFVVQNKLADYITGCHTGCSAVREACELVIGLYGNYEEAVSKRSAFSNSYLEFREVRDSVMPAFFTKLDGKIAGQKP